jgi:hypothetical protein
LSVRRRAPRDGETSGHRPLEQFRYHDACPLDFRRCGILIGAAAL